MLQVDVLTHAAQAGVKQNMILLRSLKLTSEFEIEEDIVQSVQEDPKIIGEQIIFSSCLDFDECCERLCVLLSKQYGKPFDPVNIVIGEISSSCYTFSNSCSEIAMQITCEGSDYYCRGYIHAKTKWIPAL